MTSSPSLPHTLIPTPTSQPPPAYYALFPRDTNVNANPSNNASTTAGNPARPTPGARPATPAKQLPSKESLIARYQLEERVRSQERVQVEGEGGGKAAWEDSPEKREASLRERKAKMVLSARQCVFLLLCFCVEVRFAHWDCWDRRLLEQQQQHQKAPEVSSAKS
jgi:coupling of ubiquitin conjugation to ER degradation protein 1